MWQVTCWWTLGVALASAGPLEFRTRELPRAVFGADYRVTIQTQVDGRCVEGDLVLELAAGTLPRGIELAGETLSGIPKEFGSFPLRLRAVNSCASATRELVLTVTGKPILRVTPEALVFECREGDFAPPAQVALVSGTWPGLMYAIRAANAPWLHYRANQGATPYEGAAFAADSVTVQVSPEGLAPGVYRSTMTFSADLGATMPEIPVVFRVLPKAP